MDALEQLTNVVLPTLVEKMKQQKADLALTNAAVAQGKETLNDHAAAIEKLYEALKNYKEAPEVKVRKRRTKKSEVKEEKGEWVIHPHVEHITGDDILAANYALAATKGSTSEAVLLMPDIDDTTMELVARMNSKQIREIVAAHPTTITNIDAKYATGRWDEIA